MAKYFDTLKYYEQLLDWQIRNNAPLEKIESNREIVKRLKSKEHIPEENKHKKTKH